MQVLCGLVGIQVGKLEALERFGQRVVEVAMLNPQGAGIQIVGHLRRIAIINFRHAVAIGIEHDRRRETFSADADAHLLLEVAQ